MSRFPAAAVEFLRCPHCHAGLTHHQSGLACPLRHRFDFAKQGYAPLLTGKENLTTGDNADQVAAREMFLGAGFYAPVQTAVAQAARTNAPGCLVEPGCGTGYYLAAALDVQPERVGIGLDTSKYALRRAARSHPQSAAILADAWGQLPMPDHSAATVLNVFAPRNGADLARVLHPEGHLVVITPERHHLVELVEQLGLLTVDPTKSQRLERTLGDWFQLADTKLIEYRIDLPTEYIEALALMGPSARHLDKDHLRLTLSEQGLVQSVTVAVTATTWKT